MSGLFFAIKLALEDSKKKISIVTKDEALESNSLYAQGGIAVVTNTGFDSVDNHVRDTLIAGDGLCNLKTVRIVAEEGMQRMKELEEFGVEFDRKINGQYDLHREGGHEVHRILHFKDYTGRAIQEKLLEKALSLPGITIHSYHSAIDLIVYDNSCFGATVFDEKENKMKHFTADTTFLAAGGIGHLFQFTTNPVVSTGDGIAMAHRAGLEIENMEFIQFHPTALYTGPFPDAQLPLISEAVRGHGAILRNEEGYAFMHDYDHRGDLAPRDVVSRAIRKEIEKSTISHVYLDCMGFGENDFIESFPMIYAKCMDSGIDPRSAYIPVVPAAHYSCGGVKTDEWGRTSVKNLLVCGESACTGMHGANRLASNSLLESLVFAHRCFQIVSEKSETMDMLLNKEDDQEVLISSADLGQDLRKIKKHAQSIMTKSMSIYTTTKRLKAAKIELTDLENQFNKSHWGKVISKESIEIRNILEVSALIIEQGIERKQNCGCFYNYDNQALINS